MIASPNSRRSHEIAQRLSKSRGMPRRVVDSSLLEATSPARDEERSTPTRFVRTTFQPRQPASPPENSDKPGTPQEKAISKFSMYARTHRSKSPHKDRPAYPSSKSSPKVSDNSPATQDALRIDTKPSSDPIIGSKTYSHRDTFAIKTSDDDEASDIDSQADVRERRRGFDSPTVRTRNHQRRTFSNSAHSRLGVDTDMTDDKLDEIASPTNLASPRSLAEMRKQEYRDSIQRRMREKRFSSEEKAEKVEDLPSPPSSHTKKALQRLEERPKSVGRAYTDRIHGMMRETTPVTIPSAAGNEVNSPLQKWQPTQSRVRSPSPVPTKKLLAESRPKSAGRMRSPGIANMKAKFESKATEERPLSQFRRKVLTSPIPERPVAPVSERRTVSRQVFQWQLSDNETSTSPNRPCTPNSQRGLQMVRNKSKTSPTKVLFPSSHAASQTTTSSWSSDRVSTTQLGPTSSLITASKPAMEEPPVPAPVRATVLKSPVPTTTSALDHLSPFQRARAIVQANCQKQQQQQDTVLLSPPRIQSVVPKVNLFDTDDGVKDRVMEDVLEVDTNVQSEPSKTTSEKEERAGAEPSWRRPSKASSRPTTPFEIQEKRSVTTSSHSRRKSPGPSTTLRSKSPGPPSARSKSPFPLKTGPSPVLARYMAHAKGTEATEIPPSPVATESAKPRQNSWRTTVSHGSSSRPTTPFEKVEPKYVSTSSPLPIPARSRSIGPSNTRSAAQTPYRAKSPGPTRSRGKSPRPSPVLARYMAHAKGMAEEETMPNEVDNGICTVESTIPSSRQNWQDSHASSSRSRPTTPFEKEETSSSTATPAFIQAESPALSRSKSPFPRKAGDSPVLARYMAHANQTADESADEGNEALEADAIESSSGISASQRWRTSDQHIELIEKTHPSEEEVATDVSAPSFSPPFTRARDMISGPPKSRGKSPSRKSGKPSPVLARYMAHAKETAGETSQPVTKPPTFRDVRERILESARSAASDSSSFEHAREVAMRMEDKPESVASETPKTAVEEARSPAANSAANNPKLPVGSKPTFRSLARKAVLAKVGTQDSLYSQSNSAEDTGSSVSYRSKDSHMVMRQRTCGASLSASGSAEQEEPIQNGSEQSDRMLSQREMDQGINNQRRESHEGSTRSQKSDHALDTTLPAPSRSSSMQKRKDALQDGDKILPTPSGEEGSSTPGPSLEDDLAIVREIREVLAKVASGTPRANDQPTMESIVKEGSPKIIEDQDAFTTTSWQSFGNKFYEASSKASTPRSKSEEKKESSTRSLSTRSKSQKSSNQPSPINIHRMAALSIHAVDFAKASRSFQITEASSGSKEDDDLTAEDGGGNIVPDHLPLEFAALSANSSERSRHVAPPVSLLDQSEVNQQEEKTRDKSRSPQRLGKKHVQQRKKKKNLVLDVSSLHRDEDGNVPLPPPSNVGVSFFWQDRDPDLTTVDMSVDDSQNAIDPFSTNFANFPTDDASSPVFATNFFAQAKLL